jgi:hypothetical protein
MTYVLVTYNYIDTHQYPIISLSRLLSSHGWPHLNPHSQGRSMCCPALAPVSAQAYEGQRTKAGERADDQLGIPPNAEKHPA